ncbi:MAG: beta-galactosidase [Spirosomataceae bacterium]
MKQRVWRWSLWIASALFSSTAMANDQQRYLAILLLNLDRSLDVDLDLLEGGVKAGCNAVHLTVHWDQVYPTAGSAADWRKYDNQIALAQKLGVKIALRIYLARNEGRIQGFWNNEDRQRDQQGKALVTGYNSTFFSYAHRPSVEKARAFIKEVCQRYNNLQQQGQIVWVSVCTTPTQEIGYFHENSPNGSVYSTLYDYAPAMQQEFRIWLSRKYKKVARLNVFWNTDYRSFDEIVPPVSLINREQAFWGESGKDWYVFRHAMLKQFIEQTTQTIKEVNNTYRVITDFGSVFDQLSNSSGSLAFKDLNRTTDGVKINDDVLYDNRFSIDILRSNVFPGQWVLNEVFPDPKYKTADIQQQVDENFLHGARWVSVVIGTQTALEIMKPILQSSVTKWLKTPYTDINPRAFMSYSLSRVLEFGYFSGGVYGEWLQRAGPETNRQPVDIRMVEDLLADSLQGSINRPPFVKNALPTKTIRVNSNFNYHLSPEVFVDSDGAISAVDVSGLPPWLKFSNNTFTGVAPAVGIFPMTLRATDDDGATVETSFTVIVDNVGRSNTPPVVRKRIPEAVGLYKQPLILTISDSTFFDPDGFISRVEVTGLPAWAQYRRGEIRGLADAVGEYTITARAYDDEEASVVTTFKITVNYPTVLFDLIQAGRPGQRFLLKRLQKNDVLAGGELPPSLNVYASCDAVFDAFDLELTGTQVHSAKTGSSPFALFEGDGGFPAVAGTYYLRGTAYFKQELIASTTYRFEIIPTDPVTKQPVPIDDWSVYPNPVGHFLTLKLPGKATYRRLELISATGQTISLNERVIFKTDGLLSLNLGQLNLPPGLYFLKWQNEDGTWRVFKVVKQ